MVLRQRLAEVFRDLPPGIHEMVPPAVRRSLRHRLDRYYAWEVGFDHHNTPVLAPGETNGPPGFVGIGVQKAGTSWWFQAIVDHPEVSNRPSIHKERHFFSRFGAEEFGPADIADYHAWFPRRQGTIAGEWTPDYFAYPWVPSLLAQAAPDAKLLLLLRDPVQRFCSGLASQVRNGANHVGTAQAAAFGKSLYSVPLRRWHDHFPAEQLLVMQYEACVASPTEHLIATYQFLGLDPSFRPERLERAINRTVRGRIELPEDARHRLEELMAPDVAELATLLPNLDLSLWPSAARIT
jgi:hypothetical protein